MFILKPIYHIYLYIYVGLIYKIVIDGNPQTSRNYYIHIRYLFLFKIYIVSIYRVGIDGVLLNRCPINYCV